MAVLSDSSIKIMAEAGFVSGFDIHRLGPASYDLMMDKDDFQSVYRSNDFVKKEGDFLVIPPNLFFLATTTDYFVMPSDLAGFVVGRSSVARLGIQVECAGFIDPGFEGKITLEVKNLTPDYVKLPLNVPVCQIVLIDLDNECDFPYDGRYQGQNSTTKSRI